MSKKSSVKHRSTDLFVLCEAYRAGLKSESIFSPVGAKSRWPRAAYSRLVEAGYLESNSTSPAELKITSAGEERVGLLVSLLGASEGESDEQEGRHRGFTERLEDVIATLTETSQAELETGDRGRFRRVRMLCEHAEDLARETAKTVADFEEVGEGDDLSLLPPGARRRRMPPRPLRGLQQPADQAELFRSLLFSLEQQTQGVKERSGLESLKLAVRMKMEGLDKDPEFERHYRELVDSASGDETPPWEHVEAIMSAWRSLKSSPEFANPDWQHHWEIANNASTLEIVETDAGAKGRVTLSFSSHEWMGDMVRYKITDDGCTNLRHRITMVLERALPNHRVIEEQ